MLRAQSNVLIDRTPEQVYHFVAVDFFDNYQKWSPEVRQLEKLTPGDMRVGVTGRQVRYDDGQRSEALFQVTRLDPARELRFISISNPYFDVRYLFEAQLSGTRLTFCFAMKPPLFLLPLRGRIGDVISQGSRRVVGNLKRLLETQSFAATTGNGDTAAEFSKTVRTH